MTHHKLQQPPQQTIGTWGIWSDSASQYALEALPDVEQRPRDVKSGLVAPALVGSFARTIAAHEFIPLAILRLVEVALRPVV